MKMNKPIITICIIILFAINLIFFSFLYFGNKISNKQTIEEIVNDFDFKNFLINNESISNSINNFKYPKEVFNYMDEIKIKNMKKQFINNLFSKEEILIEQEKIEEIISNSVYEYEYTVHEEVYSFVKEDIKDFSNDFSKTFNKDFVDGYYFVKSISNSIIFYISILVSIIFVFLLILFERKKGLLIASIELMCYSFFIFYLNNNYINTMHKSLNNYLSNTKLYLDNLYIICFILGFVLLLIYIFKSFKSYLRDLRIRSYISSWR